MRPVGALSPWLAQVLLVGLAEPAVAAGAVGAAAGALWLRYRAPVSDRSALGPLGRPAVAVLVAILLMVGAGVAVASLDPWPGVIVVGLIAILALLWLRSVIHLGLLEEAGEREIGPDIECPNCHRPTPAHTFCIACGVALRALPKGGRDEDIPAGEVSA